MFNLLSRPQVSVIIPVYNCARYIAKAVESVLNQSYHNYELIVIDDGSTDNTPSILQPYLNHIKYIYQENQGVAAARNRGISEARGGLVAFLDQDDFFLPYKLALQVAIFKNFPQVGIVHSGWKRVDRWGEPLKEVKPWYKAPNLDLDAWLQWKFVLPSAIMFRRDWLERVGGFDTRFKQASDLDLVLRLALEGCEGRWLHQVTVCYREHESNESLNTPIQVSDSWAVLDRFFTLPNIPQNIRLNHKLYCYHILVWGAWRLYLTNYFEEMGYYLEKSLDYTPYSFTKTVSDWLKSFMKYSSEFGRELDVYALTKLPEWQQTICSILSFPEP